jgi:hypothetical protein
MTLTKRIEDLEDHHLTPQEAVILWMREAHQFDCFLDYGRWLLEQPEEAYPLVKMPAQVVAAVRARNKGRPDDSLRAEFHRVQRDVLFLYELHKQMNVRALLDQEALRLRLSLLGEKLRGLVYRVHATDSDRLERFEFPDDLTRALPERVKTKDELDLEEELAAWPVEAEILRGEVESFRQATILISRRYLGAEEPLYPDAVRKLETTLALVAELEEVYRDVLRHRPPESDDALLRWLMSEKDEREPPPLPAPAQPREDRRDETKAAVRSQAEHFVVMARSEALEKLGEREASIQVVEKWMRAECDRLFRT